MRIPGLILFCMFVISHSSTSQLPTSSAALSHKLRIPHAELERLGHATVLDGTRKDLKLLGTATLVRDGQPRDVPVEIILRSDGRSRISFVGGVNTDDEQEGKMPGTKPCDARTKTVDSRDHTLEVCRSVSAWILPTYVLADARGSAQICAERSPAAPEHGAIDLFYCRTPDGKTDISEQEKSFTRMRLSYALDTMLPSDLRIILRDSRTLAPEDELIVRYGDYRTILNTRIPFHIIKFQGRVKIDIHLDSVQAIAGDPQ